MRYPMSAVINALMVGQDRIDTGLEIAEEILDN
jgi:hypothetical protein